MKLSYTIVLLVAATQALPVPFFGTNSGSVTGLHIAGLTRSASRPVIAQESQNGRAMVAHKNGTASAVPTTESHDAPVTSNAVSTDSTATEQTANATAAAPAVKIGTTQPKPVSVLKGYLTTSFHSYGPGHL